MSSITEPRLSGAARPYETVEANSVIIAPPVTGMSWPAILGGAVAAVALSLILLMLGSALEFSTVSPWSPTHAAIMSFTLKSAIWLIIMQWFSSALGGYITGRLRVKWTGLHTDDVFFRDTAHGFLTWAVATVVTAAFLASASATIVNGGAHAAALATSGAVVGAAAAQNAEKGPGDVTGYFIDGMFRPSTANAAPADTNAAPANANAAPADTNAAPANANAAPTATPPNMAAPAREIHEETARILAYDLKSGTVPDTDKTYLASLISQRTGATPAEAAKRVDDALNGLEKAKTKAADDLAAARKAAAQFSLYTFLAMLLGAFVATAAAAHGGRTRDQF